MQLRGRRHGTFTCCLGVPLIQINAAHFRDDLAELRRAPHFAINWTSRMARPIPIADRASGSIDINLESRARFSGLLLHGQNIGERIGRSR